MAAYTTTLRIAVLLTFESQLLDMAGIDLFGMLGKDYMRHMPPPMSGMGLDVHIFYIGQTTSKGLSSTGINETSVSNGGLRPLTAQASIKAEYSVHSPEVQPGTVDILMVPGPPPRQKQSEPTLEFLRAHARYGTTVLVICTGCYVAAQAGIYDNRRANAPRGLISELSKDYPAVLWDNDRRWVKENGGGGGLTKAELWTSGGITNGLEMIAAFIKEKVPGPLGEIVCALADVGDKGELYHTSNGVETAWWIGQVFRALFLGQKTSRFITSNRSNEPTVS